MDALTKANASKGITVKHFGRTDKDASGCENISKT